MAESAVIENRTGWYDEHGVFQWKTRSLSAVLTANKWAKAAFWRKVDTSGGADACWPWTGATFKAGYGNFSFDGVNYVAPRVALALARGEDLPIGTVCRHTCDNPPCCNPAHLIHGTHAENVNDRVERGRQLRGEKHGQSKLTAADVLEIRRRYVKRCPTNGASAIADDYGVGKATIQQIVNGVTWPELLTPEEYAATEHLRQEYRDRHNAHNRRKAANRG